MAGFPRQTPVWRVSSAGDYHILQRRKLLWGAHFDASLLLPICAGCTEGSCALCQSNGALCTEIVNICANFKNCSVIYCKEISRSFSFAHINIGKSQRLTSWRNKNWVQLTTSEGGPDPGPPGPWKIMFETVDYNAMRYKWYGQI